MNKLLAPNGKPSNLTPEQYKLVRTKAFKKWFGDWENDPANASKVVDENGEPLHLYHYSNKNFNFFKTFSFFSEIKNSYRTNLLKNEYNVYLSIQNPLELRYKKLGKNKFFKVVKEIYEGVIFKKGRYKGQGFDEESIEFMMSNANEIKDSKGFYKLLSDFMGGYNWDWVVDYAKKKGFDGVFYNETNRDLTETFTGFLAFKPKQIKLADGTNTTFDGSNPDIRFDEGGELADNIFDYLIKEKGFAPLGKGFWGKSNCTIKIDFSNVLYQHYGDNRVWVSPIEYSDYKKAFIILEFHCKDKKKGIGTAVLKEIIQGADLFGYTIFIEPTSMKKYRVETDINTNDLKQWYSKYDFKPLNDNYSDYVWLRNPKNPDIRFDDGGEARPFTDDGNKFVVFNQYRNYTPYKIAVDDVNNAEYITLWKTDTDTGEDKKMGYLRLNNSGDDFLSVSETSIDKGSKGLGLGLLMYKVALKYSSDKIKGIKSYLPDRTNKKQIPKIYKKLNSVKDGDYEFIYKENNPDIRFDNGGETNKNMIIKFTPKIIDYLADQVDIMMETYDNDYDDDDGILDEGIEEEYPFTLAKNRNDLENLQSKLQNVKGSYYSKIEKDFLIARIDFTLDSMYDDSEMVSQRRALINAQKKLQENNTDYADGGFVMDEEKGEKFIKKLSELGCNKPLTNFQMNFFGFLDSLKDDCVSLGGFWYDSNTTNYAYSQMGKMVLFDIEDFYNEKERTAFIEKNYPTSKPLEIQPFDDDNYEFIGIGEASMGGVFRDIRDGSILKLTASPFEVVGTTKILNAQKKDIHYEDNFAEIYSIQNIGKGVFKGTWYYKYNKEREFNGNWFAIRREDIKPFNEQEQKEANCVKEIIVNYYSMFDNRNYQPEIFGSYDIYEPNREYKYLLRKQNNYAEGGNINWNVDRYRQVEKEMYELWKQGKGDTIEYFKLIKERTMLEQAKMNQTNDTENDFAKGGKVIVQPADIQKYKKIGIEDKYFIEASKDVGLQGINFDSKSISKRIESQFNDMLDNYESYLINEDSASITNYINNEIETLKEQGSSLETIQRWEDMKENPSSRIGLINDIAKTQKESLDKWVDYLRLSEYKLPFKFLILKAVLNFNYDLKQSKLFERGNDTIRNFTPFDAGSLAELNDKNSDYLLFDYSIIMNENSIKILNSQEIVQQSGNGKWIKFNGGKKTKPEDIQKNGTRLMNLVQNTYWCTKSAGTSQLRGGDFYVYVTESNGEIFPRIAVRMNENNVGEVRGNKSSAQDLDEEMLPIAEEFLLKNIPNSSGKKWLDSITFNRKCVQMRKRFEAEGMYKDFIFDYMKLIAHKNRYKVDYGDNGNVILLEQKFAEIIQVPNEYYGKNDIASNFNQLSRDTIFYIGNLENYELNIIKFENFTKLKYISGNLNPSRFPITDFGNIEYVGGDVTLSKLNTNIGKIKYIGGGINLQDSDIESLSNLESVGGVLVLKRILKDLGKLKKVGGLQINSCDENFSLGLLEEIEDNLEILNFSVDINFGNLKTIGGSLYAQNTIITDLKNLESIGGDFNIAGSKIKKFENLKTIGGNADFSNNFCSSTQNIETILGNIKFLNSRIMEFPKLNKIGGTIEFRGSYFKSLGNIKYIGGSLNFAESKLEELGELDYVGGYVSFKGSNIKSLNKLKKVVGFANFDSSQVENLGDLESVGGNIYLLNSIIKSLGKLNFVGGMVMMDKNNYKGLEGNYDVISEQLKK